MRYVTRLTIALAILLSAACTNAVPVTTIQSNFGDSTGVGASAQMSSSAGEMLGSNLKIKYRMGKPTSEEVMQSASYKIKLKGTSLK